MIDAGVALVIAVTLNPEPGSLAAGIPLDQSTAGRLDALFGAEPTDPDPASLPAPTSDDETAEPAEPLSQPAAASLQPRAARSRWGLSVDVTGIGGVGQLPGPSAGAAGHVQLALPNLWPFDLAASLFRSRTAQASDGGAGRGRFDLMLASVATCPWSPDWLPALALCGGAELGSLRFSPSGFAVLPARSSFVVANLLAQAVVRARLFSDLSLRAGLSVALPLVQHRFEYRTAAATSGQLYRMSQVAARAELGVGWNF